MKGTFGTPVYEQCCPPAELRLMAPLQEQILATLDTPLTPPKEVWCAAGLAEEEYPEYAMDELPQSSPHEAGDLGPPSFSNNSCDGSSLELHSSRGFGSVSPDSEQESVNEGSQDLFSAAPSLSLA